MLLRDDFMLLHPARLWSIESWGAEDHACIWDNPRLNMIPINFYRASILYLYILQNIL